MLLPMMESVPLYENLPIRTTDIQGQLVLEAAYPQPGSLVPTLTLNDSPPQQLFCPSNLHDHFANPNSSGIGNKFGLTNYKGIGGTVLSAINAGLRPGRTVAQGNPPYGTDWNVFPDGVIFCGPPSRYLKPADITDGMSHTVMMCETMDNTPATVVSGGSRWIFALDVTVVGLPTTDAFGNTPVQNSGIVSFTGPSTSGYYFPRGLIQNWGSNNPPLYGHDNTDTGSEGGWIYGDFRTYLSYNYTGTDAGLYPSYGYGSNWGANPNQPVYGPGSAHPEVVNHVLCDGSVLSVTKDIDVAMYMFLITRRGNDPNPYLTLPR